jgi:hypothetical protein
MDNQETTLDEHSPLTRNLLNTLEDFIDEIGHRGCTAHLDSVLEEGKYLHGRHLIQKPERFIEEYLIFPILQDLGHTLRSQPKQYAPRWAKQSGIPDFALTTIPITAAQEDGLRLFGEAKPLNRIEKARTDAEAYLQSDLDYDAVLLLTDGIKWEIWLRPQQQELTSVEDNDYTPFATASLEGPLKAVRARNKQQESYQPHDLRHQIDEDAFHAFTATKLRETIETEF